MPRLSPSQWAPRRWAKVRSARFASALLLTVALAAATAEAQHAGHVPGGPGDAAPWAAAALHRLQLLVPAFETLQAAGPWPRLAGPARLEAGNCDPQMDVLRRQLARLGDLPAFPGLAGDCFDPLLGDAVRRFQSRHGLLADGVVGAASRRALNRTPAERLTQIRINSERLRQANFEARSVLVNIPAFELVVLDGGEEVLRTPVVVGRPSRPTPPLADRIVSLVLSPTWTPTPLIARKDLLPKAQADPGFLVRNRIRVFDGWTADAEELDPFAVDWQRISPARLHYRFRQDAGPLNSLGQVRFSLTNDADIYLHDTPNRELFAKPRRDFSSGCVRVADARALALFALAANPGWTSERLDAAIGEQRTQTIKLAGPLPIHLIYVTAWADAQGNAQFRNDIYGLDAMSAARLGRPEE